MKKLMALFLAALLAVSAVGCASKPAEPTNEPTTEPTTAPTTQPTTEPTTEPVTEPPVVLPENFDSELCAPLFGTWTAEAVLDGSLMNMLDMEEKVTYTVTYSFSDHGAYTIKADPAEVASALVSYRLLLKNHMVDSLYDKFFAECRVQGISKSKIPQLWEDGEKEKAEKSAEDFVAMIDLASHITPIKRVGDYYVEDGVLKISLSSGGYEASTFAIEEGVLTLSDTDNAAFYSPLGIQFPLILTPVTE